MASVSVTEPPNPEVIRHLLDLGVDVNARDQCLWTPLHFAVRTKHREVVRMLIEAGAEIDPLNDKGVTPLHLSVIKAQADLEIARMLLEAGADPDNEKGCTTVRKYLSVVARPDIAEFRQLVDHYSKL